MTFPLSPSKQRRPSTNEPVPTFHYCASWPLLRVVRASRSSLLPVLIEVLHARNIERVELIDSNFKIRYGAQSKLFLQLNSCIFRLSSITANMQLLSLISVSLTLAISTSAHQHSSGNKDIHKLAVANHRNDTPAGSTPTSAQTTPYAGPTPAAVYQGGTTFFSESVIEDSPGSRLDLLCCLTQRNDVRAQYGASPLIWSTALYPDTQA